MLHRILALPNDPKGTIIIYKAVIPRERECTGMTMTAQTELVSPTPRQLLSWQDWQVVEFKGFYGSFIFFLGKGGCIQLHSLGCNLMSKAWRKRRAGVKCGVGSPREREEEMEGRRKSPGEDQAEGQMSDRLICDKGCIQK